MSSSERANSHQVAPSHRSTFMISLESTAQQTRPELGTVELIPDDLQQLLGSNRSSQNQATIVHLNDLHLLLHLLLLHALFLYPSIVHRSSSIVGYIQLYPTISIPVDKPTAWVESNQWAHFLPLGRNIIIINMIINMIIMREQSGHRLPFFKAFESLR